MKKFLLKIWDYIYIKLKWLKIQKYYKLKIMSPEKTIEYIKTNGCSIARYGDGEMSIMLERQGPDFQHESKALAEALIYALTTSRDSNLLICMPRQMISHRGLRRTGKDFWTGWSISYQEDIVRLITSKMGRYYEFGDSCVTRPYSGFKNSKHASNIFKLLKTIWNDKDLLIVEGEKTRLGVGNDLFKTAKSIKRILAPATNAYDKYSSILESVLTYWDGELVLLALGPTATVLAADLSKNNIQALDLGHIDIQYEWFLSGGMSFVPVPGKYSNEAIGGTEVGNCDNQQYLKEIIKEIG